MTQDGALGDLVVGKVDTDERLGFRDAVSDKP